MNKFATTYARRLSEPSSHAFGSCFSLIHSRLKSCALNPRILFHSIGERVKHEKYKQAAQPVGTFQGFVRYRVEIRPRPKPPQSPV